MNKWIAAVLIALAMLLTVMALAESGTCGENLTWTLSEDGVLTVSGTGEMTDGEDYGTAPWEDVKTFIKEIVIGDGVESVGDYMFWDCGNVTRVTLGDDVYRIGKAAFLYCESLPAIQMPPQIEYVDDWAFIHCKALAKVYVPHWLSYLGDSVFYGCPNLTDIYYEDDADTWESVAWVENPDEENALCTATIHFGSTVQDYLDGVEETAGGTKQGTNTGSDDPGPGDDPSPGGVVARGKCGNSLFWMLDTDGLLTISGTGDMDDYVRKTDIQYDSNGSRVDVTYYTYPWNQVGVMDHIQRVYVSEGVLSIGNMAFSEISTLKMIYLPGSLARVAYGAFHLTGLTDVYYSGDQALWASVQRGAYNSPLSNATFHWNSDGLPGANDPIVEDAVLTLPADLTEIGEEAFLGGTFSEVHLDEYVTSIGSRAFADCTNLWFVKIQSDDITIADDAFEGCGDLVFAAYAGSSAIQYANAHGISVSVIEE